MTNPGLCRNTLVGLHLEIQQAGGIASDGKAILEDGKEIQQ